MIEYTLLNILISELKIYCGPDKFYGWSKFGQYDEVNNRAPSNEDMCLSHLHIHDIVHNVYYCTMPIDNVLPPSNHSQDYFTFMQSYLFIFVGDFNHFLSNYL